MGTTDGFKKGDPLRVCDICGVNFHKSELKRIGPLRWACPDDASGLTAEQIARHNASVRPLTVKPVKNPRPPIQTPTYQQAEADILNLILKYAPQQVFLAESGDYGTNLDSVTGLDQTRTAGWMAFYLANLALENRRPTRWIQAASAQLLRLCDSMLRFQLGGPASTTDYRTVPPASTGYGGFYMPPPVIAVWGVSEIALDVTGAAVCLMALVKAYQISGLTVYRDGARRAATFLRRAQCIGLYDIALAGFYATANPSGARFLPGPFPETFPFGTDILNASTAISWSMKPSGIVCAWALDLLRKIDGDQVYGDTAPVGIFAQRTDSTLSAAVQACTSWWAAGFPDPFGTTIVGFGATTPQDSLTVFSTALAFANQWAAPPIYSANWALGIRSLWEIGGFTGQAAANYNFLRSGLPNTANQVPGTWGDDQIRRSLRGTYDPDLALATSLTAAASDTTGDGYDWRSVGLLAPIQSSQDGTGLGRAKDALSVRLLRRWRMRMNGSGSPLSKTGSITTVEGAQYFLDPDTRDDPRLLTHTGLSMQTSVGRRRAEWAGGLQNGHYLDLQGAVIIADAYRYSPGAFPLAQG